MMQAAQQSRIKQLPAKFRDAVDKYGDIERARKLKDKSVYLHGGTGTGKTFLACLILREVWSGGGRGKFIKYPELILRTQMDFKEFKYEDIEYIMKFYGCLVLDDYGAERGTDFTRSVAYNIIDWRESNELQTIITSNFSPNEIGQQIDMRIASRIVGMCEVMRMDKKDRRLRV